jgi:HTH-type transcriptional regulator/antitoxin HipB
MTIDSIHDLASTIRGRRLELGLSQAEIADRAGVSREWVNSMEAGKSTVELVFVLRLISALDLRLSLAKPEPSPALDDDDVDLDELLDEYRTP